MKKKVYVVPHSHWDREWYFTLEDSNILLGDNMHFLMEYLENNSEFKSYTFDAQASVIDEFILNYPEEKERLKKLISKHRIFVGPWYTQADSLLVNKESVIRNLLYGIKTCESYGHVMNIGYLPDIFGQNAYLPSIFKNFDLDYSIFQRGIYTDELKGNLNINWESPDGEIIKANNIYLGYGPGKFLSSDDEYIEEKLLPILQKLSDLNIDSKNLLLPAGGDQVLIRTHFPETIKKINEKLDDYELVLSDYETFMNDSWKESNIQNKIVGELRGTEKSRIHRTIGSSRYDIKKLNTEVENKILNLLEPLAVIADLNGIKYPKNWLDRVWKLLFDVHAHDSIGGCNSDDTNKNIIQRLEKVDRIVDGLLNLLKKKMTHLISQSLNEENIFVIFNLDIKQSKKGYEVVLFTREQEFNVQNEAKEMIEIEIVEQEYISGGKQILATAKGDKEIELPGYYRSKIFIQRDLTGLNWEAFIVKQQKSNPSFIKKVEESAIENEYLSLQFKDNNLILKNLITEETIESLIKFEDCRDFGDTYDYSPLENDKKILSCNCNLIKVEKGKKIKRMILKNILQVPKELYSEEIENLEILTIFELRETERILRVSHEIQNNIKDHRIRVILNTPLKNIKKSYANSGFSFIPHSVDEKRLIEWKDKKYSEAPIPIYNMENTLYVKNEKNVFGVIAKGIKEYEIIDDKIALTLFRSVGLLGRDDLLWRPGRASGINNKVVYTPDSQLLGKLSFDYAISWIESEKDSEVYEVIDTYIKREVTYHKQNLNTFEERLERFEIPLISNENTLNKDILNISNKNIVLSSFKKAYEGEGYILRVFNPNDNFEKISIEDYDVFECNLKEEEIQKIEESLIKSKSYKTFKIKKKG
ncbi:MAG: glycoside hydrolase family 38 C-terminal domain-containing protein, partial [Cetobacterium sp.]